MGWRDQCKGWAATGAIQPWEDRERVAIWGNSILAWDWTSWTFVCMCSKQQCIHKQSGLIYVCLRWQKSNFCCVQVTNKSLERCLLYVYSWIVITEANMKYVLAKVCDRKSSSVTFGSYISIYVCLGIDLLTVYCIHMAPHRSSILLLFDIESFGRQTFSLLMGPYHDI